MQDQDPFERVSGGRFYPLANEEDAADFLSEFPFRACSDCEGQGRGGVLLTMDPSLLIVSVCVCPTCEGSGFQPYVSLN